MELVNVYFRYWIYAILTILLVLITIFLYRPTIKSIPEPILFNLPSAYCSSSSIHANCFFGRSLCYNISSSQWETSTFPFYNWSGVSLRSRGSLFRDSPAHAACNEPFLPKLNRNPVMDAYWINGTCVLSCIWVYVFGHIFLEMMLPAWLAMKNIAERLKLSDQNITYVLDNRFGAGLAQSSFTLLSHRPILAFNELIAEANQQSKSHLCFDKLIIGYRLQSSLEYAHNVAHLENGDLARYRDYIKVLHGFPTRVNMSEDVCIALIAQRGADRRIVPESEKEIIEILHERTNCTVKVASFDTISISEQVRLVSEASVLVHVSGSGAHHFIWLPDRGASLLIVHPKMPLNALGNGGLGGGGLILNEFLCWKHPTILCVTAGAKSLGEDSRSDIQVDTYSFSNALDMIKLWQNRGRFDPRDPTE